MAARQKPRAPSPPLPHHEEGGGAAVTRDRRKMLLVVVISRPNFVIKMVALLPTAVLGTNQIANLMARPDPTSRTVPFLYLE